MNLIHQDFKAPIHDLVDLLRVEFLSYGSEVSNICKKHCYQFSLPLDGAPGGEDFVGQEFRGVRMWYGIVDGNSFF
jgi:hypothetical protein